MSENTLAQLPPLVAFTQSGDGKVLATRVRFEPISAILPQDIFSQGVVNWAAKSSYPFVGGEVNDIWSLQAAKGPQIQMLYLVDYITWNSPVVPRCEDGKPILRHLCGKYPFPVDYLTVAGYDSSVAPDKVISNYKVVVRAKDFQFDKILVFKTMPYSGGVLDMDAASPPCSADTNLYLAFVDLERRRFYRMPMSNIYDNGHICLKPVSSAQSISHSPSAILREFASSPGNTDLASDSLLSGVYFTPIPETEDESGEPWLQLLTTTPGVKHTTPVALTVPDFWTPFAKLIEKFLSGDAAATKPIKKKKS